MAERYFDPCHITFYGVFQSGIIIYFENMEMYNKIRDFDDIRWIFILSYKIKEPPK